MEREAARGAETPQWPKSALEQTRVTLKWTQMVEERWAQSQSRHEKKRMTNIYLTCSNEKASVDFVKNQKELYDKTNKHFKYKARNKCLWEMFTTATSYLSKCARLGSNPKLATFWSGSQSNDRETELGSGLLEDTHQMQGTNLQP